MNLNKAIIVGRVTAAPELRHTPGGTAVTTFGVATNRVWMDKVKGKQEEVEFHNIVAWGRSAEIASQFLQKGQLVMVEGRLKTRSWQDKQNQTHRTTEIICDSMQLGPKAAGAGMGGNGGGTNGTWTSKGAPGGGAAEQASPAEAPQAAIEEIPVINLDEEPQQMTDDIPF